MWAHYARNHTGVCYGFDISIENLYKVRYVAKRLRPDANAGNILSVIEEEKLENLISTKFEHWSYEEEYRMLVKFPSEPPKNSLVFEIYSQSLKLREVIIGFKSDIAVSSVEDMVDKNTVDVFKSRPAFQDFKICRQLNKSIW